MNNQYALQLALERQGIDEGIARYRNKLSETELTALPPGAYLLRQAVQSMAAELTAIKARPGGGGIKDLKIVLSELDAYTVAYLSLKVIINMLPKRCSVPAVASEIASVLKDQMEYERFRKSTPKLLKTIQGNLKTSTHPHKRRVILRAKRLYGISDESWPERMRVAIGLKLIETAIVTTGFICWHQYRKGGRNHKDLEPTPQILEYLEKAHAQCEVLEPILYPMIITPVDWSSISNGGFLTHQKPLVQCFNQRRKQYLIDAVMPEVYAAVNTLQHVPYAINTPILQVMQELWESGGGIAGLPTRDLQELPSTPWSTDEEFELYKDHHPEVIKQWKRSACEVYDRRARDTSKRLATMLKLRYGQRFQNQDAIYFVWTMDWRGRMYPAQSFVTPQADDPGRALLQFAEGKPITDDGLYWLYVHGANKFGVDKVSYGARLEWVESNLADIRRCGSDPLEHRFWIEADSPFQFLAFCMAVNQVHANPKVGIKLPISVDGSCNGLQQFSALLRDEVGGAAVNLVPQAIPADVYQLVADEVSRMVSLDAANGNPLAQQWAGKITRQICKRAVMTTPYGVKLFGIRQQLLDELRKEDVTIGDDNFKPCMYLTEKLYEAIGNVVIAARACMDWLQLISQLFSDRNQPILWTTPSGFVVCQDYRKLRYHRLDTLFGKIRFQMQLAEETPKIDRIRNENGISPNFIHSLDASHLMKTVNACRAEGIKDFLMIHDSFGTLPTDMPLMSRILRDQFVEMYRDNLLQKFADDVARQLPDAKLPPLPTFGNLKIEDVLRSSYFFG